MKITRSQLKQLIKEELSREEADEKAASLIQNIKSEIDLVKDNSKWNALKADQQKELATRLDNLIITDKQGIEGIKSILNAAYNVNPTMRSVNEHIEEYAKVKTPPLISGTTRKVNLSGLPKKIKKKEDIDTIIDTLNDLKGKLKDDETIELNW